MPDPDFAQPLRQNDQAHRTHGQLVKQQLFCRHRAQLGASNHHRGQAPGQACAQAQQVAQQLLRRCITAQAFAHGKHQGHKGNAQTQPLHPVEPLGLDEQRQQNRHPERRHVQKHRQAGGGGKAQTAEHAGKLQRKQAARQQPGPQRAVASKQGNTAPAAPQPHQHGGAAHTQSRHENGRYLGQGGFGQHLLAAPDQAAKQQQAKGQPIDVFFTLSHGEIGGRLLADVSAVWGRLPVAIAVGESR